MDEPDLFKVGRKKPRTPKPKSPHAKRIQEIMLHVYFPLYVKTCGEKPLIQPRDWGLLRIVVDEYGPDVVEARLRDFFRMDDQWVREAGYSMGVFKSRWAALAAQRVPRSMDGDAAIERSRKLVEEMKGQRASGRI